MSTSASTRSGWASTTRRATMPPIECPSSRKRVEPERVGHREHVGGEAIQRVGGRLVGRAALPVTAQVERDDAVVTRERLHVVGEVLLGTAEAVYQEQRWGIVGGGGHRRASATPSSVVTNAVVAVSRLAIGGNLATRSDPDPPSGTPRTSP